MRTQNNRAWLWVIPALLVVLLSGAIPMMTMVNYSLQDVFAGDHFVWVGALWFEKTLTSAEFYLALLRSLSFSALVLSIEIPLGLWGRSSSRSMQTVNILSRHTLFLQHKTALQGSNQILRPVRKLKQTIR